MIYISAQPDLVYFIWQLEIQLRNLRKLGISKEQIHVLIAKDEKKELNPFFESFIMNNIEFALFFIYGDKRKKKNYTSSIRPHILKQHFSKFPQLEDITFTYHDSDILFSRIPEIKVEEDTCYVSDTRNYLDIHYIREISCEGLLDKMLNIVGLKKAILERENNQSGGAQYILSNIKAEFWEKVEVDSERLFVTLQEYNEEKWQIDYEKNKEFRSKRQGIQSWCADMWAVLWNLWIFNKKVKIHSELSFAWPYSPIQEWEEKPILHYSGKIIDEKKHFKKTNYFNYVPYYDQKLDLISKDNCSYKVVEAIKERRLELDESRPIYSRRILFLKIKSSSKKEVLFYKIYKSYIQKHIDVNVRLLDIFEAKEQFLRKKKNE